MLKKFLVLASLTLAAGRRASAQASPTASRLADLQAGVTFSLAKPDYGGQPHWHGYGLYADLDFRRYLGLEVDFHQLSGPDPTLYERTYEIGPRVLYPIRQRFLPYAKVMYGRGVFNFAGIDPSGNSVQIANLAYNIYSGGGGLDVKTIRGLNIRVVDFEYQRWPAFPPRQIDPRVLSFGVAYHFHGNLTR